ncbi:MFS transporter [Candidatus Bathyarchaeota archaeon]|nr:MFS transporter [Candidatus Bathyarchaeota archaeon]
MEATNVLEPQVLLLFANHSAYGFNNFFPSILKGFKLGNRTTTMALTAPPYVIGTAVSIAVAWSSDRLSERGYHISVPMFVAAIGFAISVSTLNIPARYLASFLYTSGCFSANSMVHSWFATVLNQTPEKRACVVAIINMMSQLGNVASPYFFPNSDEPRYVMAMCLMMGFSMISIASAVSIKAVLKKANKELLREGNRAGERPVLYPL